MELWSQIPVLVLCHPGSENNLQLPGHQHPEAAPGFLLVLETGKCFPSPEQGTRGVV